MKSAADMRRQAKRASEREKDAARQRIERRCRLWGASRAALARRWSQRYTVLQRTDRRQWPLPRRTQLKLALRRWEALDALATGKWQVIHGQILAGVSNIAQVLSEWGLGWEHEAHILVAQKALAEMRDRMKPGECPLDKAGLEAVLLLLRIHDAQVDHPDCTRLVLYRADQEIKRRICDGNVIGKVVAGPQVVKAKDGSIKVISDISATEKMVVSALTMLREQFNPADGSPADDAIVSIETFAAVSMEIMKRTPPNVVRECTRLVLEQCRTNGAAEQERKAA